MIPLIRRARTAPETTPAAGHEAPATTGAVANSTQAPITNARPPRLGGALQRVESFASRFHVPGRANLSQRAADPAPASAREGKKQLNAALGQWAKTEGIAGKAVLRELKKVLDFDPGRSSQASGDDFEDLNLHNKQLTSFPAEMAQAKALGVLTLSCNQLTSFPAEMGQAKALCGLDLSYNKLTRFPAEMGQANRLQKLKLSGNQLTSFPAEMGRAKALDYLELSGNQLTSFPAEMGQAKALRKLDLSRNQLTSFPAEMGQAKSLENLDLSRNQLTSFPAEMGQAKALENLDLSRNQLTSFPAEMGQAKALRELNLSHNQLTSFPQAKALHQLDLSHNQLTSFPAEMGQATALQELNLSHNQLTELPAELAQLRQLHHVSLNDNQFARVPPCLLELPPETEIDLRNNPLPQAEIIAVRALMDQRRAAGQTVPQLLLPPLAVEAGDLREAVANQMNVHTTVLTDAFKKRLDDVAKQFPEHLRGTQGEQRVEMAAIAQRLTDTLNDYEKAKAPDPHLLAHARGVASLMFRKGQGEAAAYYNDFDRSTGHVLGYTFLAMEAQLARTPDEHKSEARHNGMAALITALESGEGMCDTRLCEEVMQTIGLPLSRHAEAHREVTGVTPPTITASEMRDVTFSTAKKVLHEMLEKTPGLENGAPPDAWRPAVAKRMQQDHPKISSEQWEPYVQQIESTWETFHDMVNDEANAAR